jgi:hypothetical protein
LDVHGFELGLVEDLAEFVLGVSGGDCGHDKGSNLANVAKLDEFAIVQFGM